jgi:hypothetical protein
LVNNLKSFRRVAWLLGFSAGLLLQYDSIIAKERAISPKHLPPTFEVGIMADKLAGGRGTGRIRVYGDCGTLEGAVA